jgi:putative oxidoreductase
MGNVAQGQEMKKTPNAQRSTLNAQRPMQQSDSTIERWVLDVGRWAFAPVVKMDSPSRNVLCRIVDLIVGGIFIYAGVIKAIDPLRFAIDIDNYKMLPWAIGVRLAFYLPWLELLCGLALILRFFYRGGLFILAALTFIFIAASIIAKVRGLDITCGCFGHASNNWSFTTHVALDFVILVALIALWIASRTSAAREL